MTSPKHEDELRLFFHLKDQPRTIQNVTACFDITTMRAPLVAGHEINLDLGRAVITNIVHDFPTTDDDSPGGVWVDAEILGLPWEADRLLRRLGYVRGLTEVTLGDTDTCRDSECSVYGCSRGTS